MDPVRRLFERLSAHYGPQHWWPAESPFEVIVGALLMQQTAWTNVEKALANLKRSGLLDPTALAGAPVAVLRRCVRVAGLYRTKPARLRTFARHLLARSGGDLRGYFARPTGEVRADLLGLPGVGPETADSILLYAGGHAVFVVDAYTVRIGRRVGLLRTQRYGEVQDFFESRLGRDVAVYREGHALLVQHAKTFCRATPRCGPCPLRSLCAYGRSRKA